MGEVLRKTLGDTLRQVFTKNGLDAESSYEIQNSESLLWVSSVYKVSVNAKRGQLHLFLKCLTENEDIRESLDTEIFFRNEVAFYNDVLNPFIQFQEKRKVKKVFSAIPKCFLADSGKERDVIVLEDLKPEGFIVLDRMKIMPIPELHLLMQELGRFHALSLAMKDQEPKQFQKVRNSLKETVFCERFLSKFGELYEFVINDALKMVKHNFPQNSPYLKKIKDNSTNICQRMMELVHPKDEDEPYNVVTHGDLWVSNLMFRYSESNEIEETCCKSKLENMKILDFQVSRYASPALDVSYVLLSSMDNATRELHQTALLRSYHKSLSDFLSHLGSDPEKLFPYSALEEQLKKYARFGLWLTLFNLPHTLDEGENVDVSKQMNDGIQESTENQVNNAISEVYSRKSEHCQRRILDAIKYVVDKGYLN